MQGKVEICGVNTSKLQTLSNAEMMRLIEPLAAGGYGTRVAVWWREISSWSCLWCSGF